MNKYAKQDRGEISEYEEYFAGMDKSMQQKIALTTAHFPSSGTIADMGSGSGSGTFDLARLYKDLNLVGVDINPVTVEYSNNHYKLENLRFETGDIADMVFAPGTLDGILDSSVLHHVTSFNGFDVGQIDRTIANQVLQLKPSGVLIIRDFVVPDEADELVFLDLPTNDGQPVGEIASLSTAALFEVFARDFRSSLNLECGVSFSQLDCPRDGFSRFEVTRRTAAEFVLRKDYRDHWAPELLEEYTYCSQSDFEALFRKNSMRIVVSMPLWNPWIVANRFEGKFFLSSPEGRKLHFPPTNFLIVGEKTATDAGVQLRETSPATANPNFLQIKAYRHDQTGQIWELAERPNQTLDLVPWFKTETGQLFIVAKKDFPRPVVNADPGSVHLNRANYSGYLTEPISAIIAVPENADEQRSELRKAIAEVLEKRAGISADEILGIDDAAFYFPSAGAIDERVESHLIKIPAWRAEPFEIENYTPFSTAGVVRELDALQVLRASHVGGMFDARLEINVYRLLKKLGRSAGAWIGAELRPGIQTGDFSIETSLKTNTKSAFTPINEANPAFLELRRSVFGEFDSAEKQIAAAEFEYVIPRDLSKNTLAAIPFFVTDSGTYVGVEFRDLPAVQRFSDTSEIACVPAWRLPKAITHRFELADFVQTKFGADFGTGIKRTVELGGSYFTSAGITPEVVYPLAAEIDLSELRSTSLRFYDLKTLLRDSDLIRDAHLLILLNRLAHALGLLSGNLNS